MIVKRYKFITIREIEGQVRDGKRLYDVHNNKSGDALGIIWFYAAWKAYTFVPSEGSEFSADCLRDVIDFVENHAGKEN